MKSWTKDWQSCKPCIWIGLLTILVFLVLLPLSISSSGVKLGNMVLPVRLNGDIVNGIYLGVFGAMLPILTWVSLILHAGEAEHPFLRMAVFQGGMLIVVLLPLSVKLKHFPTFHSFLVAIIFLVTLDGMLKLFDWLFRNRRSAASIAMACIQLAGPVVMYMNDFRDFFPHSLARMAAITYLEFPFYGKAAALLKEGSLSPMIPDFILALVVAAIAFGLHLKKRNTTAESVTEN